MGVKKVSESSPKIGYKSVLAHVISSLKKTKILMRCVANTTINVIKLRMKLKIVERQFIEGRE